MSADIEAGEYELVAEIWDEITSKPKEPLDFVRHRKGEIVKLGQADARRLVLAGAVVKPGEREAAKVALLKAQYEAALAALPPDVRAAMSDDQAVAALGAPPATVGGPVDEGSEGAPAGAGSAEGAQGKAEEDDDLGDALPAHLRGLTVDDLKTYAATNEISIKGLTKKAEIQAAIVQAEAE